MYAGAYPLGLFKVDDKSPQWVETIRYFPEPPIAPKGAFNPWQLERTRLVYLEEEKTWKEISVKMAEYRRLRLEAEEWIRVFNIKVAELESMTGKKSGLFSASNIASFVASSSGNPYIMAAMAIKMVVEFILGSQKQKKIKKKIEEIEVLQRNILANNAAMEGITRAVMDLLGRAESLKAQQTATAQYATQASEITAVFKRAAEEEQGKAHRAMVEQHAVMFPAARRAYNDAL